MNGIVFTVPANGEEITSPDMLWLREQVLRGGRDFWCCGSGQGCLKRPNGARLGLSFADGVGFFLEYSGPKQDRWIPFSEGRGESKVPVWIGGDPVVASEQFFVSPDLAWIAVEEFSRSGDMTEQFEWQRTLDLEWQFGWWDHPEMKFR